MRWVLRNKPLDPATTTLEELVRAKKLHDLGVRIGAIAGAIAAILIYLAWDNFGYEKKWVQYTMLPAIVIGGCLLYRIVYEIVIRFRP